MSNDCLSLHFALVIQLDDAFVVGSSALAEDVACFCLHQPSAFVEQAKVDPRLAVFGRIEADFARQGPGLALERPAISRTIGSPDATAPVTQRLRQRSVARGCPSVARRTIRQAPTSRTQSNY